MKDIIKNLAWFNPNTLRSISFFLQIQLVHYAKINDFSRPSISPSENIYGLSYGFSQYQGTSNYFFVHAANKHKTSSLKTSAYVLRLTMNNMWDLDFSISYYETTQNYIISKLQQNEPVSIQTPLRLSF